MSKAMAFKLCNVFKCPGKDLFNTILNKEGINILALIRKRCENKKKIILYDGTNKGIHHVIKMIFF